MNKRSLLSLIMALVLALTFALPAIAEEVAPANALDGKLVILHTNDIHGYGMATDTALGYARIAQLKKNVEALGASVLLLDAGDAMQGTPLVNLSYGKTAFEFMNQAGYDAMTPGNHEFDWGIDVLLQNAEVAEFAILCANITRTAGGDTVFAPNKIFDMPNGLKVGVFGLDTPETMTKAHPDKVQGISFAMNEELYACAQAQVDELTEAGCDVIICLGHLGIDGESEPNRSIDVLANVTGITLLIDGHSHSRIEGGEMVGDTMLTSTGNYSEAVGYVIVDVEEGEEGKTVDLTAGLYTLATDDVKTLMAASTNLVKDADVDAYVTTVNDQVEEELSASFATTTVLLNGERAPGVRTEETNMGDFAADAILWSAKQALGEDQVHAALTNGGGIRASIQIGDVTMKDMKTVFPFGNEVAVLTVSGAELLEALEAATYNTPEALGAFPQVAGIEFTVDTTVAWVDGEAYDNSTYFKPANPGARVTIATVAGEAFDLEKMYVIATNDFTAAGGDTYGVFAYPYANSGYKTGVALEDALINYTREVLGGTIGDQYAEPQGRITIIK